MIGELSLTKEIRVAYESVCDLEVKRDKKPRRVLQNRCIPWLCPWPPLHLQLMSFVRLPLLLLLLPFLPPASSPAPPQRYLPHESTMSTTKTRAGGNVQAWRDMILLGTTSLRISSSKGSTVNVYMRRGEYKTGLRTERKCTLITTLMVWGKWTM